MQTSQVIGKFLMQKRIKYLLTIFFLINGLFLYAQKGHQMHGYVNDENGKPIEGVKITVNKGKTTKSDKYGNFSFWLSSENEEITNVKAVKRGYDIRVGQLKWGWVKGDDKVLSVMLKRTPSFSGKAAYSDGKPASRVTVKLTGDIEFSEVYTKTDGSFYLELPHDMHVSPKTIFVVNGKRLNASEVKLYPEDEYVELTIQLPKEDKPINEDVAKNDSTKEEIPVEKSDSVKKANSTDKKNKPYKVLLMDGTEFPLAYLTIFIEGIAYKSDATGSFKLEGPIPTDVTKYEPSDGHEIVQIDVDEEAMKVHIQVKEAEVSDSDSLSTGVVEEYKEEMNRIIKGLQQEKMILTVKAIELRRQIARLADRLGQERNLSPKERESLGSTLLRLEQTLEQNDEAYQRAQRKTEEAIGKLKDMLELSEREKDEITAKARKERLVLLAMLLGVGGVAFAFFIIGKKVRKQKEELEEMKGHLEDKVEEIKQKNDRIMAQTDSLKALNHAVTAKNQKITDSIFYAKTIQEAILPTQTVMDKALDDYFILYEPKEIVSGDFYWFSEVEMANSVKKILVAAVDCTGHGVPGGFMSMIGNTLLNEIVNQKQVYDTSKVLDYLNNGIKAALKQDEKLNADGMDVCLCAIEEVDGGLKVEFSGARRPLFYLNAEKSEVGYLKGNPHAIGGMKQKSHAYHEHEVILKKGDIIYLTSDGLMAQGDSNIGKIGTNGFKKFVQENAKKPLIEQKEALQSLLKEYQSDKAQRDDILVFAIKL